jgi:hypothetical protein
MSQETPDFNIDPDGGMTAPAQFTHNGHRVEIVPPDTAHLIGKYWQIKIDGVLQRDLLRHISVSLEFIQYSVFNDDLPVAR